MGRISKFVQLRDQSEKDCQVERSDDRSVILVGRIPKIWKTYLQEESVQSPFKLGSCHEFLPRQFLTRLQLPDEVTFFEERTKGV